eukprot:CAMPEP_0172462002 /NCGR_PEP_ID=MMETSP1065-20121228/42421_1 /TAXON_ID=265537 /ORGANISM="Amphiprora paludosa, Strain CCMP125" /LENGTH=211 /DNA_ID=CAMNT_0013217529 /DNA_START=1 /DNA_END=633 /DNA_ORIENTATION=+
MECQCMDYTTEAYVDVRKIQESKRITCQSTELMCNDQNTDEPVCAHFSLNVRFMGNDDLWSVESCVDYANDDSNHLYRNGCLRWDYRGQAHATGCAASFLDPSTGNLEPCASCQICQGDSFNQPMISNVQVQCPGDYEKATTTEENCHSTQPSNMDHPVERFFPGFRQGALYHRQTPQTVTGHDGHQLDQNPHKEHATTSNGSVVSQGFRW